MNSEEITQIQIGQATVGIIGLKETISELAPSLSGADDKKIAETLLTRLAQKNYIPEKAREQYGQALVREFKRHQGQEVAEPASPGLTIRILGMGCVNCQTVYNRVMEVLNELHLTADLEHVTDMKKIATYGVMGSPALLVNGKVVSVGQVPNKKQIQGWIERDSG
ncbi:MAG: thioredoxin family protein [Thermodesulfobacteriota bacterium]